MKAIRPQTIEVIAAVSAVQSGKPVSNSELKNGIAFLREVLFVFDHAEMKDRYFLFVSETNRSLEVLENYAIARGIMKPDER